MEYKLIHHVEELHPYIESLKTVKVLAIDTETTGLDPNKDRIRLIQIATDALPVLVIDCFSFLPDGLDVLREVLMTSAVKVFQHAKFDLQFLMKQGIFPHPIFDTMLAAQVLRTSDGPTRANLATLSEYYLSESLPKEEQKSDWGAAELTKSQLLYAARDAHILLRLRGAMIPDLIDNKLVTIAKIEFDCAAALASMELNGIYLSTEDWAALCQKTNDEKEAALEGLYEFSGRPIRQTTLWGEDQVLEYNFNSNPFVLKLLKEQGIIVPSTSKQDLAPYRKHPFVKNLTDYRRSYKSLSTFLYPLLEAVHPITGRLHPHYGQIGAGSGRMSCGSPNIQQIPRDLAFRACFTAPKGRKLIVADYSQIELRVAAQISGDARMRKAYQEDQDLHALTASLISHKPLSEVSKVERQAAKAVNFGLIFGMGAAGLMQYASQSYGVEMSMEQATQFRDRFFKAYPGIKAWHQRLKDNPPRECRTLTGRKFRFPEHAMLTGQCNMPVQGTAADIAKKALGMLAQHLAGTDTFMIGVVHDEILLECPEEEASEKAQLLKVIMEQAANSILPDVPSSVEAKVSDSWAEK